MLQIFLLMFVLCGTRDTQGWKGIVPLHSSRTEVERTLGPPSDSCKHLCRYETKSEVVFVRYSGEPCTNNDDNRWRVPANTAISVSVNLENRLKLSTLKLNRKKFTKTNDPELHGYTSYSRAELGVSYAVDSKGLVYSINWFPTLKDENALQCASLRQ
jgi:hypothetical protein